MSLKHVICSMILFVTLPLYEPVAADIAKAGELNFSAVFTLFTYRQAEGQRVLFGECNAFLVSQDEVLTNKHCLVGASEAEIADAEGNNYPIAGIIADGGAIDALRLKVTWPDKVVPFQPFRFAEAPAKPGQAVTLLSRHENLPLAVRKGKVLANQISSWVNNSLITDLPGEPGMSGSPILNDKHEICGLVSEGSDATLSITTGPNAEQLHHLARQALIAIPRWNEKIQKTSWGILDLIQKNNFSCSAAEEIKAKGINLLAIATQESDISTKLDLLRWLMNCQPAKEVEQLLEKLKPEAEKSMSRFYQVAFGGFLLDSGAWLNLLQEKPFKDVAAFHWKYAVRLIGEGRLPEAQQVIGETMKRFPDYFRNTGGLLVQELNLSNLLRYDYSDSWQPKGEKKGFEAWCSALHKLQGELLIQIKTLSPEPHTWLLLGQWYRDQRRPQEAKSCFVEALLAAPDYSKALFWLWFSQAENGEWGNAEKTLRHFAQKAPRWLKLNLSSMLQAIDSLADRKTRLLALDQLVTAVDVKPSQLDGTILFLIGNGYFMNGRILDAAQFLDRAEAAKEIEAEAIPSLLKMRFAAALVSGDEEKALATLDRLLTKHRTSLQSKCKLLFYLLQNHYRLPQRQEIVIKIGERLLAANLGPEVRDEIAKLYVLSNMPERSLALLRDIPNEKLSPLALFVQYDAYLQKGNFAEAKKPILHLLESQADPYGTYTGAIFSTLYSPLVAANEEQSVMEQWLKAQFLGNNAAWILDTHMLGAQFLDTENMHYLLQNGGVYAWWREEDQQGSTESLNLTPQELGRVRRWAKQMAKGDAHESEALLEIALGLFRIGDKKEGSRVLSIAKLFMNNEKSDRKMEVLFWESFMQCQSLYWYSVNQGAYFFQTYSTKDEFIEDLETLRQKSDLVAACNDFFTRWPLREPSFFDSLGRSAFPDSLH